MFESMLGIDQPQQNNNEEKLLDKQLDGGQQQAILDHTMNPQTDLTYLDQQKEKEDLVKWQQDLKYELELLEHDLKREYFNETKSVWMPIIGEDSKQLVPSCNETCIQMIRTNCRPLLSRNMIMSNFSEDRILQLLKRTMASVVRNIVLKHDDYEVDYFNISYILGTVKNYIIPAPFRSLNNGERKHLDTINRRIETFSGNPASAGTSSKGFALFKRD